jgi:putative ABC transport system permease protein
MSFWESMLVALDNLRVNKLRSFLTIIGIVVGVGAVVTVVSIGQAGQQTIVSDIQKYGEGFFVIYPNYEAGSQVDMRPTLSDLEQVKRLDQVKDATGALSFMTSSKIKNNEVNFNITATTSSYHTLEKLDIQAGHYFSAAEERARQKVVVVDSTFAIDHYGNMQQAVGRKLQLGGKNFRIIGVYKPAEGILSGLGSKRYNAYMPVTSTPIGDGGTNVRFDYIQADSTLRDPDTLKELVTEVRELLAKRHNVSTNSYLSQTGAEAQDMVNSTFGILQIIIGSIAGISLLVGGIGVMNIMLVSVTERTREIGIRKAIGATPGVIMGQFMIEAVILCFMGGIIGTLIGLLGAFIFSMATGWPFVVSWWAILLAFGFSAGVGIFFGLYPANKASRLQPIEALRYE